MPLTTHKPVNWTLDRHQALPEYQNLWLDLGFALPLMHEQSILNLNDIIGGLSPSGGESGKSWVATDIGLALSNDGTNSGIGGYSFDIGAKPFLTYVFVVRKHTGTGFKTLLEGSVNDDPFIGFDGTNFVYYNGATQMSASLPNNQWGVVTMLIEESGAGELWIDGVQQATDTNTGAITSSSFSVFFRSGDAGLDGDLAQLLIAERFWTPGEIVQHAQNPWGMFTQRLLVPRQVFIPAAGAPSGPPVGSLALMGVGK